MQIGLNGINLKRGQVYIPLKNTVNVLKMMQLLNVFDRCENFRNKTFYFKQHGIIQCNTV